MKWPSIHWIIPVAVILSNFAEKSEGLACFQCSGSRSGSECESDMAAFDKSRMSGGPFYKNCSLELQHQRACIIETSHNSGRIITFIRDCSDGKNFSFANIPRLTNLDTSSNQTTCAASGTSGTVVCISLCDTDFCNGPLSSTAIKPEYSRMTYHVTQVLIAMINVLLLK